MQRFRLKLQRSAWLWLGVVLLLAVQLPHFGQGDFRTDTGRYASIGLLAARSLLAGDLAGFFTLHAPPGEPYFNKPPLAIWIHGLVMSVFGPSLVVARLPALLAAAGCCVLTALIGRTLVSRSVGLWSGVSLALSYEFFRRTREISLDIWQLLFVLGFIMLVVVAVRRAKPGLLVAAGAPLGLALLCKPFVALLSVPLVAAWLLLSRKPRLLAPLAGATVLALAVAGSWHLAMHLIHGQVFWETYLGRQVVDRAAGDLGSKPFWFYLPILLGTSPWFVFAVLAGVTKPADDRQRALKRLTLVWGLPWLILLSVFADKSPRYAELIHPATALLSGLFLARFAPPAVSIARRGFRRWGPPVIVVGALVVAVLPVRVNRPMDPHWAELFAFIEEQGFDGEELILYEGAMDYAKAGRVYLETGWWPKRVEEPALVPQGAMLLYHSSWQRLGPGAGETVVFQADKLTVTRLESNGWQPVETDLETQ